MSVSTIIEPVILYAGCSVRAFYLQSKRGVKKLRAYYKFFHATGANEIPFCQDDPGVLWLHSAAKKVGESMSFCVVTVTFARSQKIFNKSLLANTTVQKAVQCSIHEVLIKKNNNFLDFSELELVTEAPSSFSFLYHRKFLYRLQLANLSTLSVTNNLELIAYIDSKTPMGLKILRA
jgi:hypothetical protein